jgi:hypothetical protein
MNRKNFDKELQLMYLYQESSSGRATVVRLQRWKTKDYYDSTALGGLSLLIVEVTKPHLDTPPDDWETHLPDNTLHSQDTTIYPAGFELAILARKRPQTHALDRAVTAIGEEEPWWQQI